MRTVIFRLAPAHPAGWFWKRNEQVVCTTGIQSCTNTETFHIPSQPLVVSARHHLCIGGGAQVSWVIEIDEKTYKRVWLELSKVSEVCQLSSDGQSRATVQSTVDERNVPHTSMFRAVLFIIAKIYKQPKCLTTDDRIKKIAHTHNRLLFSHKNE